MILDVFGIQPKREVFSKLTSKKLRILVIYLVSVFMVAYRQLYPLEISYADIILSDWTCGNWRSTLLLGRKISYLIENIFVRYEKASALGNYMDQKKRGISEKKTTLSSQK